MVEVDDLPGYAAGHQGLGSVATGGLLENGFQQSCLADPAFALKVQQMDSSTTDPPLGLKDQVATTDQRNTACTRKVEQPHACLLTLLRNGFPTRLDGTRSTPGNRAWPASPIAHHFLHSFLSELR